MGALLLGLAMAFGPAGVGGPAIVALLHDRHDHGAQPEHADLGELGEPFVVAAPAGRVTVLDTDVVPELPGRYAVNVSLSDGSAEPGVVVEQVVTRRVDGKTGTSIVAGAPGESSSSVWSAPAGLTPGLPDALLVLNVTPLEIESLQDRQAERRRLAASGLRLRDQIPSRQ